MYQDDGSSLLFGPGHVGVELASLHPAPMHVFSLWQTFIENVHPIVKILHVPTVQQQILKATSDLPSATSVMHALMFGIFSMALTSLDDHECRQMYDQEKSVMLGKFHTGSQYALREAEVLRSNDIMALQALVLHLVREKSVYLRGKC